MEKATIKGICLAQTKAGVNAIKVECCSDDNVWARGWIWWDASEDDQKEWIAATGFNPVEKVKEGDGHCLIGCRIQVEIVDAKFGNTKDIQSVSKLEEEVEDDDDFSDLCEESPRAKGADDVPF